MLTWLIEVRPNALSVGQSWDSGAVASCRKVLSANLLLRVLQVRLVLTVGAWAEVWHLGGQRCLEGRCSDLCSTSIWHVPKDCAKAELVLNKCCPSIQNIHLSSALQTESPYWGSCLSPVTTEGAKEGHRPRQSTLSCGRWLWPIQMATQTDLLWFGPSENDQKGRKWCIQFGRKQEGQARETGKLKEEKEEKLKKLRWVVRGKATAKGK